MSRTLPAALVSTGAIGRKFLHAGPGFGGSCFPKDCQALVALGGTRRNRAVDCRYRAARQRGAQTAYGRPIIAACGGTVAGKTLGVLGSPSSPIRRHARQPEPVDPAGYCTRPGRGSALSIPEGMAEARKLMPDLDYCGDAYGTMAGADALRADHRVETNSRARSRPGQVAAAPAGGHRPAQHLPAGRDGLRPALLCSIGRPRVSGQRADAREARRLAVIA